jgi:hypothetical protein
MTVQVSGEYKGYRIVWSQLRDCFDVSLDGAIVKEDFENPKRCMDYIDGYIEKMNKQKFKRTPVFRADSRWDVLEIKRWVATSYMTESGSSYAWVSHDGRRSKEPADSLCLDNEANNALLEKIEVEVQLRKEADVRIKALFGQMHKLTIDAMIEA